MNILFSCDRDEENKEYFLQALKKRFKNVRYIDNYIPNKNQRSIYFKMIRGLYKKFPSNNFIKCLYSLECKKFYTTILNEYDVEFDFFLSVAKEFSVDFLNELKLKNPKITTILYLWDKLEYTSAKNSYKNFDKVFSFDRDDTKTHPFFSFRPTFFLDYFRDGLIQYKNREFDLYYIGQIREVKRIEIIKSFFDNLSKKNMNLFIKLFKDRKNKQIHIPENILLSKKISYSENIQNMKNSKVTIDISYKQQTGLTLRCFEALATETKIITDNADILNYDFYNPNNIFYIKDISDIPNIPEEFFKNEYHKTDKEILYKYSIDGFLDDIFNNI